MMILSTIMLPVPLCQLVHMSHSTVVGVTFYLLHSLIGTVPQSYTEFNWSNTCICQVVYCFHKFHFYIYATLQLILILLLIAAG